MVERCAKDEHSMENCPSMENENFFRAGGTFIPKQINLVGIDL
jgi:hypothetical protein